MPRFTLLFAFLFLAFFPMSSFAEEGKPKWRLTWEPDSKGVNIEIGKPYVLDLKTESADAFAVTFQSETPLPKGAVIEQAKFPLPAQFRFTPSKEDVGIHDIQLVAKEGANSSKALLRLLVVSSATKTSDEPEVENVASSAEKAPEDFNTYLSPGLHVAMLAPTQNKLWGNFYGGGVEFLMAGWIHSNRHSGPSHGRVFFRFDLLKPQNQDGTALLFNAGFDLSLEKNPKRTFLIPIYGFEMGGLFHKNLSGPKGFVLATPSVGAHLYAAENIFVSTTLGYQLPLSGRYFDEFQAVRATLSMNVSFW